MERGMNAHTERLGSRARSLAAKRRVRLAAVAIALTMIAACAKDRQQVTDPSLSGPRFGRHGGGVVGGNSHRVSVCVDLFSSPGLYSFSTVLNASSNPLELPTSIDPNYSWPHTTGPYIPGDVITAEVSVEPGHCADVFQRALTLNDANNRLWDLPEGLWNPEATVDVTFNVPPGHTYSVNCADSDPTHPLNCTGNPVTASADIFGGSSITFTITGPEAAIQALRVIVSGLGLPKGAAKDLDAKLVKARAAVLEGRTAAACKELAHVIAYVTGHTGKVIASADAENVVTKAREIQTDLGC
jgi:hypothetical protein